MPENALAFAQFLPCIGDSSNSIFELNSLGIATNRDEWVYDFDESSLVIKIKKQISNYNSEVSRVALEDSIPDLNEFINSDSRFFKWTDRLKSSLSAGQLLKYKPDQVRKILYRPFTQTYAYFDSLFVHRRYQQHKIFPKYPAEELNLVIAVSQTGFRSPTYNVLITKLVSDLHLCASVDGHQCLPFYTYAEDGTNRRENITDWALEVFRSHYGPCLLSSDPEALIRPAGTFSRGEKGGNATAETGAPDLHLSSRERSDVKRTGEGITTQGDNSTAVPEPLIRPAGTFSRGEKGEDSSRPPKRRPPLDPDLLEFARKLRETQTEAEQFVWAILRNRRLADAKFRRQYAIDPYVLDFYCHEAKLAVELDGGRHNTVEARKKDDRRTRFLADKGIKILRFWNNEVFEETEGMLEAIALAIDEARVGGIPDDPHPAAERPTPPLQALAEEITRRPITKWDIFHYVYGVLHQPEYRTTFADNLKRELPRIPFMADFEAFAEAGRQLSKWHLEYESVEPWPLKWVETPGVPLSCEVTKMKLSKDKTTLTVNASLTLENIPPEVQRYRLGNRSALEWVVDQYQVSEDLRSGIRSDPNRADDPEYIVRLVGQVVRVSVETVKIVEGLPKGIGVGMAGASQEES